MATVFCHESAEFEFDLKKNPPAGQSAREGSDADAKISLLALIHHDEVLPPLLQTRSSVRFSSVLFSSF